MYPSFYGNSRLFCANRVQNLLEVVHDLFEEQTSLEKVILKIMQRAQRLLKCDQAAVLLLDENSGQVSLTPSFRPCLFDFTLFYQFPCAHKWKQSIFCSYARQAIGYISCNFMSK